MTMRKLIFLTAALFCLPFSVAHAQEAAAEGARSGVIELGGSFLTPLQERDSVLIADQLRYGFRLDGVKEGTGFAFPDYSKGFRDSVEVVSSWMLDTLDFKKGRKGAPGVFTLEGSVVITSFDEGKYMLPPISVLRRDGAGTVDTLVFNPQVLEVKTIPVDTAVFELHDIKGQIRYPLTFKEILPYLGGAIVLCVLIALAVYLILKRRKNGLSGLLHKEPAHIVALRKLDHLRGNKYWAADKQKLFYSGVTDALREYIVSRYGVSAMEMTTKEIFDGLSGKDIPADLYDEARSLFERADFVKFAKYVATDEENASAVPVAVRFVTQTYQTEIDAEGNAPQPDAPEDVRGESGASDSVKQQKIQNK